MEPDIMSSHLCSPPPLDGDGDGGLGSEEDDFGDLSLKMACSPLGLTDATEPTTFLNQTSPAVKPATHQPNSAVESESDGDHVDVKRLHWNSESSLHYSNGCARGDLKSGAFSASIQSSPEEETGFADFTLFTEQVGHPWCCGFTEQWDGKVEKVDSSSGERSCNSGQEFITDSEPRPQHASEAKEDVCIKVKHCEKRHTALEHPPQDHHQPQEAVAALNLTSVEEELQIPGSTQEKRCSCDSLQASEVQRNSEKLHQTFTEGETASDEWASCCNDFSFESASAELEPNVVSSASQHDQADSEVKELENCRHTETLISSEMTNLSLSESDLHHCSHYMTQETSATSSQSHSRTNALDNFAHFTDSNVERHRDQEPVQTADTTGIQSLGNLPPSDSFADFCSAPTQEDEEGLWADFKDQTVPVEEKSWTQFREQVSKLNTGKNIEEELERSEKNDATRRNSCQASLSCRVQQLLQSSFPEVLVPVANGEEELVNLGALLQTQNLHESEEELSHALRIQRVMLRPHQELLWSFGLQFQWGGSHTKTSLLRCLGVDTRNIVFMGTKKQPVTVPAYTSSLGILESTKKCLPALCSPGSPRSWGRLDPSTHSVQVVPSSHLD